MKYRIRNLASAMILLAAAALSGCGQPQMGADPETFKAVDALYTAVSLRDPAMVDRCTATLKSLLDAGKLDRAPFDTLEGITTEAKAGGWEPAQTRLAKFMRGQKRGRA